MLPELELFSVLILIPSNQPSFQERKEYLTKDNKKCKAKLFKICFWVTFRNLRSVYPVCMEYPLPDYYPPRS